MNLLAAVATGSAHDWPLLGDYLASPDSRLIAEPRRLELRAAWQEITHLEEGLDDALLLALVGGTGVGKSTLINAIAGQAISRSGDRRPTTSRVVVYIHRDTELPPDIPTADFSEPFVQHSHPRLRKLVLLDFPDFDSAETTHADILRRHLPHLDVLFVLVDDVKYADQRLYELLRGLEQDPQNLFVILNKVDRLRQRYPQSSDAVIAEILRDLHEKLKTHAGLELPMDHLRAISAQTTFQQRQTNPTESADPAFAKLEQILESFQEEKRRRLAKERNLHVRKEHLVEQVRELALSPANLATLANLRELVNHADTELQRALAAIPQEVLGDSERRIARGPWMRAAGRSWGIPISLFFTLLGELPFWKSREGSDPSDWQDRIERHYLGYLDASRNLARRFHAELLGTPWEADSRQAEKNQDVAASVRARQAAQSLWQGMNPPARPRNVGRRIATHLPALAVIFAAVATKWSQLTNTGQGTLGWLSQLLGLLSPLWILNIAVGVVIAYLITAIVAWLREIQRLEESLSRGEALIRESMIAEGTEQTARLTQRLETLEQERQRVRNML